MSKEVCYGGAWMAQSVEHPTLDFGTGHDLSVLSAEPAWDSLLGYLGGSIA